jgi:hypothetical protein
VTSLVAIATSLHAERLDLEQFLPTGLERKIWLALYVSDTDTVAVRGEGKGLGID